MRRFMLVTIALLMSVSTAMAQDQRRGGPGWDKSADTLLTRMKKEVVPLFQQKVYMDELTGKEMLYNLFLPRGYNPSRQYPLLLFIGDASTTGEDVLKPLNQGWGGLVWATKEEQERHPCIVVVPQFVSQAVNDDWNTSDEVEMAFRLVQNVCREYSVDERKIYTTGQSMGGMISLYYNIAHPNFFAASIFVGCQWDTTKMASFAGNRFFYIIAEGDMKAPKGMADMRTVLQAEEARMDSARWSAKLPDEEQVRLVDSLLARGSDINFVQFSLGSVLPDDPAVNEAHSHGPRGANEHMQSFDYAYRLSAVRDWLFRQERPVRSDSLLTLLKNPGGSELLVVAHNGDWHGTTARSIHAFQKAMDKGAAVSTIDTVLPVERLRDLLAFAKGKLLVAFDNPAPMLDEIKEVAAETETSDIVLLFNTQYDADLMYVPVCDLDGDSALRQLEELLEQKPVAVELQFSSDGNAVLQEALTLCKGRTRVLFNTTEQGRSGSHKDKLPRGNFQESWGALMEMGGTLIETDEIKPLLRAVQSVGN